MKQTVRIENDGVAGYDTRITDVATGTPVAHVMAVDIHIEADGNLPQATLTVGLPIVNVLTDAELKRVCPCCGRPVEDDPAPDDDSPYLGGTL